MHGQLVDNLLEAVGSSLPPVGDGGEGGDGRRGGGLDDTDADSLEERDSLVDEDDEGLFG